MCEDHHLPMTRVSSQEMSHFVINYMFYYYLVYVSRLHYACDHSNIPSLRSKVSHFHCSIGAQLSAWHAVSAQDVC